MIFTGLDRSEAEADPGANVVLPARAPALTRLSAVGGSVVGKQHDGFGEGIFQLDFAAPVRSEGQAGVGAGAVKARPRLEHDIEQVDVEAQAQPGIGVVTDWCLTCERPP